VGVRGEEEGELERRSELTKVRVPPAVLVGIAFGV